MVPTDAAHATGVVGRVSMKAEMDTEMWPGHGGASGVRPPYPREHTWCCSGGARSPPFPSPHKSLPIQPFTPSPHYTTPYISDHLTQLFLIVPPFLQAVGELHS
jgi:hypothetical protein